MTCSDFFIKVGARSCRCASVPNQNRFVGFGLRLGVRPEITASILPRCYKQGARAGTRIPALVLFAMTRYNQLISETILQIRIWRGDICMSQKAKRSGMGVISILTLILIVLKLTGLVSWSWLWVLSPIWISGVFIVIAFATILITGRIRKGKW